MFGNTSDPTALQDLTQFLAVVIGIASPLIRVRHPAPFPISSAASSRMSLSCHDAKLAFMKNRTSKSQTFFSLSKIWGAVQVRGRLFASG